MRRHNRPSFPPGSLDTIVTPPPGLPPPTEEQRIALRENRRLSNSIAYDRLVAGNPQPEAANIPRPSPPGHPIPPAAVNGVNGINGVHPVNGVNGIHRIVSGGGKSLLGK